MNQNNTLKAEKKSSTRMIAATAIALIIAVMSAQAAGAFSIGQLNSPSGVAVDNSTWNIYVADSGSNSVKIFNSAGGLLNTVSGLSFPMGVAVDSAGNIYVADSGSNSTKKFNSTGSPLPLVLQSPLDFPMGVAVDSGGNIYVADSNNDRVLEFDSGGGLLVTIGQLNLPGSVAVDGQGNIYVADSNNSVIKKFNSSGSPLPFDFNSQLSFPMGVAVDGAGNIYAADSNNDRILKTNSTGGLLLGFGTFGTGQGQFDLPGGVAVDVSGKIYVVDTGNNRVQVFGGSGTITGTVTDASGAPIAGASVAAAGMTATTNATGGYSINIAQGSYVMTASAAGFVTGTASVTVVSGTVTRNFALQPALVAASITRFSAGNGIRGSWINADVNVTNSGAAAQTLVVVVSGVSPQGYPLAGTATLMLAAGESMANVPVLVSVPPVSPVGGYTLFAGMYKLETYPNGLIMARGPTTVIVS